MKFKDIKKFIEENGLPEDTEIFVDDGEEGIELATELTIMSDLDSNFRLSKPTIVIR